MACGLAPTVELLIVGRLFQGAAAAVMMPSSMALIRQAYQQPVQRARAVAQWAMGSAAASSSRPVLGGVLTLISWRTIFFVNVPVDVVTLVLLTRVARSPQRQAPLDWLGQATAILAVGGLTYGAITAGADGFDSAPVLGAFAVAVAAFAAFVVAQARGAQPMVPLDLFRSRTVSVASGVGFAFIVGYWAPVRHEPVLAASTRSVITATGLTFLPMMLIGADLTPFSACTAERFGARTLIHARLLRLAWC